MPDIRDLLRVNSAPSDSPSAGRLPQGPVSNALRVNTAPDVRGFVDQAEADNMGQFRRGVASAGYGGDANSMAADEASLRAQGRAPEADALRERIAIAQQRAQTFAPAEQDATKLGWNPGRMLDYGLGQAGSMVGGMAEPVGAEAGLSAAGKVIGMIPHPAARAIGAGLRMAGPAAAYGLMAHDMKGGFYNAAAADPAIMAGHTPQELNTQANLYGAGAGLLATALPHAVAGRVVGDAGIAALRKAPMLAKPGLDSAGMAGIGAAQEAGQQHMLTGLNPNRDTSGDADSLINAGVGGAAGVLPISGLSHLAAAGHARTATPDDKSNDVSGKTSAPKPTITESLTKASKPTSPGEEAGAEAWRSALEGSGPTTGDPAEDFAQRQAALTKELQARAEKGQPGAEKHLDAVKALDPSDPTAWSNPAPDDAMAFLTGPNQQTLVDAYRTRKLNEQNGPKLNEQKSKPNDPDYAAERTAINQRGKLAASIMSDEVPHNDAFGDDLKGAASDLGHEVAEMAGRAYLKPEPADLARAQKIAEDMVGIYGDGKKAQAVLAKIGTAANVAASPLFKAMQKTLASAGDAAKWQAEGRATRDAVAQQLVAQITAPAQLRLRKAGVDLTNPVAREHLLAQVQAYFHNETSRSPIEMNATFGAPAVEAMRKIVGQRIVPRDVEDRKSSGGEKVRATGESDEKSAEDEEGAAWDRKQAEKNVEAAPGQNQYFFKGGRTGEDEATGHPFTPDKKSGNLPFLARADAKDSDGTNTLERIEGGAYEKLGAKFGKTRSFSIRPADKRPVTENFADPNLGLGSVRVRVTSAKEVLDAKGISPSKRVELLRDYLSKGDKPILGKDDPTIQQIGTLDKRIAEMDKSTPRVLGGQGNPKYAELQDLKGQRKEVVAALAAKIGVDVPETAGLHHLADAYFGSRHLVVAEHMAEKDGLRLTRANVTSLGRRGAMDLKKATDPKVASTPAERMKVEADMNLIRFKDRDGVDRAVRASDLVKWVFKNSTAPFEKKDFTNAETRAHDYRNALMEGVGALVADGHASELPHMVDAEGKVESFKDGFPKSLKLGDLTQAALDMRGKERATAAREAAKAETARRAAMTPTERNKEDRAAERVQQNRVGGEHVPVEERSSTPEARDEARTARQSEETDGAPNEFRHQGVERGAADRKVGDKAPAEKFWDAPELAQDRSDRDNIVPTEAEREQTGGVPTDRTELTQRNAIHDAALPKLETLTAASAMRKAGPMADSIWGGFRDNRKGAYDRLQRLIRGLDDRGAGGRAYAAPAALLLTPERVARLVATAKDQGKARAMLDDMRSRVANSLTKTDEGGLAPGDKLKLAKALTGDDKLTIKGADAALEKMSWPARMADKAAREEGVKPVTPKAEPEGKAAPISAPVAPADKQTAWAEAQLAKGGREFVKAIKDFKPDQLIKLSETLEHMQDEAQSGAGFNDTPKTRLLDRALDHVNNRIYDETPSKELNELADRKLNEQTTPAGVQSAENTTRSDKDLADALAHVKKVLGDQVKVEVDKAFPHAGEYIDAEHLIKLGTTTGPGLLNTAYHESMHALFAQLTKNHPDAAEALKRVMSGREMVERLKDLLKDHPDALKALDRSPEERVAYAYQFWAAGHLDVDRPATTVFDKVRKLLRKVFGMVRDSETALDLMTAFHKGDLAEPSAAGSVISKIMKDATWNADVKRKFDKAIYGMHKAVSVANDTMRKEVHSATARALGLKMFTNPGEEGAGKYERGYINARSQVGKQYSNYFNAAIEHLRNSPRDLTATITHLQLGTKSEDISYAPVRKAVDDVRGMLQRYHDYAVKAGLKLENLGADYFPRVWDLSKLIEGGGKDNFTAMLNQPKYEAKLKGMLDQINSDPGRVPQTKDDLIEAMHRQLIDRNGVDEAGMDGESDHGEMIFKPFFASEKERHFKWLDKADVEPFLDKDLVGAVSRYLNQGVRAAEFTRRFGEGGKVLKELFAMKGDEWENPQTGVKGPRPEHGKIASEMYASLKQSGVEGKEADEYVARHMAGLKQSVAAQEGSLGGDISAGARKLSSAVMAYQNLRLLPMSLFAAFGDISAIAAGGGGAKGAYEAFTKGISDVYTRWKDAASDMPAPRQRSMWDRIAEAAGAVDSHMYLEQMGKAHTSEFMTDFARNTNRKLFMLNGLTAWDRSMRVSGTKLAVAFLEHHADLPDKVHSERWLAELGLKPGEVPLDKDGHLIWDKRVLAAERAPEGASEEEKAKVLTQATSDMEKVHYAITRYVERSVLSPNAAQRPSWASDPHYSVLFHLKQFTYSMHHTVLKRALNEATHGNMNPIGALAGAIPVMMASDAIKGLVVGGGSLPAWQHNMDIGQRILMGAQRGGLAGVTQFGIDALHNPASLFGPTVEQAVHAALNPSDALSTLHDAIPGARMIGGLPDLSKAIGD